MQKLQEAALEVERLGELFLINKEQIVEADRHRQANREALAALRRQQRAAEAEANNGGGASTSGSSGGGGGGRGGGGGGGSLPRPPQRKVWLLPSAAAAAAPATFVKLPTAEAIRRLEADQSCLDALIEELRAEQKRLTARLAERGAGPEGAGEGLLRAMLNLKDTGGGTLLGEMA